MRYNPPSTIDHPKSAWIIVGLCVLSLCARPRGSGELLRGHQRLELQFRHVVGQPLPHDPAGGQRGAGGRHRLCPRRARIAKP